MSVECPKGIEEIYEFTKKAETLEDFVIIQAAIANFFNGKNKEELEELINSKDNFYIDFFDEILNKKNFLEALDKVLKQLKFFSKNYSSVKKPGKTFMQLFNEVDIKNKKIIFIHLITSLFFISALLSSFKKPTVDYVAKRIRATIKRIKNTLNYKYSSSEISTVFLSVFNKNFYPKIPIPFKVESLDHLFKQQKISSYLISLAIKLSFRNSLLNANFKSIEKHRLEKTFGYSLLYSLNNFIKSERAFEKNSTEQLKSLLGDIDQLKNFIKSLNEKNEENAFNLIEMTVKRFKLVKNHENDIAEIMNNVNDDIEEIQNYGIQNFKAFCGTITEENYEWSNKIYINCCKLLGAINGLSKAIDNKWKINALTNEYVDWTFSIHKILNKSDIEDDWEKISKYLEQETNKVEWKSTFLTPTKKIENKTEHELVSKKIFYGIVKTMIGMMNTDGGVIIIGLAEKPEYITDEDIKKKLLEKRGKNFIDISKEFSIYNTDLDGIKRKLQDSLKKETLMSVDNFNNLWEIQPINIKSMDGKKEIIVYKIEIKKSEKQILSANTQTEQSEENTKINETDNIWISLLKRADARTIRVDPRKYFEKYLTL